jgi:mevalonate kinase
VKRVEIFIPGKIMLAGEYAVLRGSHALAATVAHGMTISLEWQNHAAEWEIHSNLWSEPKIVQDDRTPQVDMLCRAVQAASKRFGFHGGRVTVSSDLEVKHGLGSSSALRLGICAAFHILKHGPDTSRPGQIPLAAAEAAYQLQSEGQGIASGYDIATQLVGGLVEFNYEFNNNRWTPHWFRHDLGHIAEIVHVFVGGKGAPTSQTTMTTAAWLEGVNRLEKLIETSENLIDCFNVAIHWPDRRHLQRLVQSCGAMRQIFVGSPHFPAEAAETLQTIAGCDQQWSWKTTGAGGEDAIILVGRTADIATATQRLWDLGWHRLDAQFAETGARIVSSTTGEPLGEALAAIPRTEIQRD